MNKFFFSLQLFSIAIWLCTCAYHSEAQCGINTVDQIVNLSFKNVTVEYKIDSSLVDISEYLTIEHWGVEAIKRYVNMGDTLTVDWNDGSSRFTDAAAIDVVKNRFDRSLFSTCDQLQKKHVFDEMHGVSFEAKCNGRVKIIFFCVNTVTDKTVLADFTTSSSKHNYEDAFFCMLQSMKFKISAKSGE